jgi:hypothetical protein
MTITQQSDLFLAGEWDLTMADLRDRQEALRRTEALEREERLLEARHYPTIFNLATMAVD